MSDGTRQSGGMSISAIAAASTVGTTIEWYDFFLYNTVTPLVFNKLFFPEMTPLAGMLAAYTTSFVGFLSRPIGGVIFGHYGDRIGRKTVLVLTIVIMGMATFLIGLLPTYATAGYWAPAMLLALRVFQGIGIGGEWGGAVLLAVEHSPGARRGFYGSWPQIGVPGGLLLSAAVVSILSLLPDKDFLSWGWRIAFLLSAVLVAIGLYIRLKIMETPAFTAAQQQRKIAAVPVVELFSSHLKPTLLGLGARFIEGVTFNIYGVFIIYYVTTALQLPRQVALTGVIISSALMIVMLPIFGNLSDKVGRKKMFGVAGLLIGITSFTRPPAKLAHSHPSERIFCAKPSTPPVISISMKLRCDRRSSSMFEIAAMRPLFKISTSSHVSSMSRSRCDEMSRCVPPCLRISLMS